jgi:hypothetical protein
MNIEMTADKQSITCKADKNFTLKIKVTNKGTVISQALTLLHEYLNEDDEEVQDVYDVCNNE